MGDAIRTGGIAAPRAMKYLMGRTLIGGYPVPIIFPPELEMGSIAMVLERQGIRVMSAGFLDRVPTRAGGWEWKVLSPITVGVTNSVIRPGADDEKLLRLFLEFGLSGPQLQVMVDLEDQRAGAK